MVFCSGEAWWYSILGRHGGILKWGSMVVFFSEEAWWYSIVGKHGGIL